MQIQQPESSRYGKHLDLPLEAVLKFYESIDNIANEKTRRDNQRRLVLTDVFYLLTHKCGRKDMIHPWIYDRCREVQKQPNECLDLWARDHYKSTIITFGMTIQEVLNNPEITILILSHIKPIAQKFLKQIMTEFERNSELKSLFPHILWANRKERKAAIDGTVKWSEDDGIVVKRSSNPMVPTIMASGLTDGMPTATHFNLLVYDDVVVPASVTTPEQRQKTTEMFDLSDNLGSQGKTWKRVIGTRYHLFDTYASMIKRGLFTVRLHPATSDGSDDPGKAVLLTPEALAKKKLAQGNNFNAQMLLNPKKDSKAGFKDTDLRYWPAVRYNNLNRAVFVDPSSGRHREKNKGDFTGMVAAGKGADEKKYILDIVRDRLDLPGRINTLFQLVHDYKIRMVFYEETGYAADVEAIKMEQARRNYHFTIIPLGVKGVKKTERILRLQTPFQNGDIFLPERAIRLNHENVMTDFVREFVEEEYIPYPQVTHDDVLDAMSQMEHPEVIKRWIAPLPQQAENPILTRAKQMQRQKNKSDSWMAG